MINKIDLPNADLPSVHRQLEEILAIPAEEAIDCSAKMGIGIEEILEAVVHRIPPPPQPKDDILRALVFDSVFDIYRGVVAYVRVFSGKVEADQQIKVMSSDTRLRGERSRRLHPEDERAADPQCGRCRLHHRQYQNHLGAQDRRHHDRLAASGQRAVARFSGDPSDGLSGIYPINTADFEHLKTAIGKLRMNDSAFVYQPESSVALGFGYRCGFLGLLHMEIIQERLRREYDMDIIATSPSVIYEVLTTRGEGGAGR